MATHQATRLPHGKQVRNISATHYDRQKIQSHNFRWFSKQGINKLVWFVAEEYIHTHQSTQTAGTLSILNNFIQIVFLTFVQFNFHNIMSIQSFLLIWNRKNNLRKNGEQNGRNNKYSIIMMHRWCTRRQDNASPRENMGTTKWCRHLRQQLITADRDLNIAKRPTK